MKIVTIFLSIFLLPAILLAEISAEYNLNLTNVNNDNNSYFDGSLTLTSDTDTKIKTLTILKDGFYDFAINGKPVLNRSRVIDIELTKKTPTVISYKKKVAGNIIITDNVTSLVNIAPLIMDRKDIVYLFNIKVPKIFTTDTSKKKKENDVKFYINHPLKDLSDKTKGTKTTVSTYIFKVDKKNDQFINSLYDYSNHYKNMLKSINPDSTLSTALLHNDDYAVILEIYAQ